jgi:regulator of protease activity HflC (stomatin/prohibitin superfamily)
MEFLAPLLLIAGILGLNGFKIDREYQRGVIFRLGRYQDTKGPNCTWIIPLVDQKMQVDIRTKTVNIARKRLSPPIMSQSRLMRFLYYRIIDPSKAINKVESYPTAVYQAAMTTLRNVVGQNRLDDVSQKRDEIRSRQFNKLSMKLANPRASISNRWR